ncbi:MAG: methyltransferase domain-containing protein [Desulfobacteraceae bacterium]
MAEVNLYESNALRDVTGPVIRPGGFALTERGMAYCGLALGARVLDVGCGTGAAVHHMRHHLGLAAMGIDRSSVLLEDGIRSCGPLPLLRGRAEALPVEDERVEAVLCECVLSLCTDPLCTLREALRVLQPGGYLVLTDVYSRGPYVPVQECGKPSVTCCLQGAADRPTVEARVTAAGFDLLLWEDHSSLLKRLAAQLVWTYGSLDAFWSTLYGPGVPDGMKGGGSGGCTRPGYYLLVAQKPKKT